ncbi:MAG: DMT family transporter [Novosphingobium sp.]|nr:DMT family transporter [Novosphingobium sp.]
MKAPAPTRNWNIGHLAALLGANLSMGVGPLFVRMAETGPAATGFWRHIMALPFLALLLIWREPTSQWVLRGRTLWIVMGGGVLFGLNLVFAYTGFTMTRLGNVVLLGNSGGVLLMIWGLIAAARVPRPLEMVAVLSALVGGGLLIGGSLHLSFESFRGDLMGVMSGICYAGYLLILRSERARIGQFTLLFWATLASMPILLVLALALGETIWPDVWWPIVALTVSGHLIGQGLLVYALRHFSALVIGLALLTQPAISSVIGWLVYGEALGPLDVLGMVLLAAALVIVRASDRV